jgi:hypothetical protein
VVGGDDFIQWIKGKFSNKGKAEREQPALRELRREKKPEELIEHYAQMRKRFNTLNDQFLQKSK